MLFNQINLIYLFAFYGLLTLKTLLTIRETKKQKSNNIHKICFNIIKMKRK